LFRGSHPANGRSLVFSEQGRFGIGVAHFGSGRPKYRVRIDEQFEVRRRVLFDGGVFTESYGPRHFRRSSRGGHRTGIEQSHARRDSEPYVRGKFHPGRGALVFVRPRAVFVDFAPPPSKKTTTSAPKDGDEEKGGSNTDTTTSDKEEINDENENNDFDEIMLSVEEGLAIDAKSPSSSSHFSISVLSSAGPAAAVQKARRSLTEILFKTDLWLRILAQSLSYNIMALWMMNVKSPMADHGYNDNQSTLALTYHMLGMFLPSLFSGHVISALGTWPSAFVGFAILLLGGGLFYVNGSLLMFYLGITIVGVGWNLSFVGPSAAVMSSSVIRQTEDGEHD